LPAPVEEALSRGFSIIPTRLNKNPRVSEWKPYQTTRATREQVLEWERRLKPPGWAIVTGEVSGIVALDFDGKAGMEMLERFGLQPHIHTGSGGAHVYVKHPGQRIRTTNGKTDRAFGEQFPGLDIRGDGGYAIFCGANDNGRYQVIRELEPLPFEAIPAQIRELLKARQAEPISNGHRPTAPAQSGTHASREVLIREALDRSLSEGRNNAGFWLAAQARDNRFIKAEAVSMLLEYQRSTSDKNAKGETEPYTEAEARKAVEQAYSRAPREPWSKSAPRQTRQAKQPAPAAAPPERQAPARDTATPSNDQQPYFVENGITYRRRMTREGIERAHVCNFEARIVEERTIDDGTEQASVWIIRAVTADGARQIEVPAKDFRAMNWVHERLGSSAIIQPGQAEHARTAFQMLSSEKRRIHAYVHTGWRKIDGKLYYLHGRGAIGEDGTRTDIQVSLKDTLPDYELPAPPTGTALKEAIRASLRVLDVAPDRLTFPVLAAVYRAILGPATFSLFISGHSGQGKTQLAALAQQHFGPRMDGDHLPAAWNSTGFGIQTLAFHAQHAILVVDDFVPAGNASAQQRLHGEADKALRAQANSSGRHSLSSEGKLKNARPPRGIIISTGESEPRGKSLAARMVILRFAKGAMDWKALTECQHKAQAGMMAQAAAAFIHWAAPRLPDLRKAMEEERFRSRQAGQSAASHMRTPDNLQSLQFGLHAFLTFAAEVSAITPRQFKELCARADAGFVQAMECEADKITSNDPARLFLKFLRGALHMGKAHVLTHEEKAPEEWSAWGWQERGGDLVAQGSKIGWIKGTELWLQPEASHAVAVQMAQQQNEPLPGDARSIRRDLAEQGFLLATDTKRGTYLVRRTPKNCPQELVICLCIQQFSEVS
ncbi:MAG TPA: bifunctional DNA primase/polymerase, partial [Bryobacteraceae bacterium]|nr:bifunctional DNA primase/polymerase [Bryobacteraceae bacterium]